MRFQDIPGQQELSNHLTETIDAGRVSHAQLFLGHTGIGSLALAIAYTQYLNCEHRRHYATLEEGHGLRADSCGECPSCRKFQELIHSDLHFVFPNATAGSVTKSPSSSDFQEEFRTFLKEKGQMGSVEEWYAFLNIEKKQGVIRERDADEIVKMLSLKSYEGNYKMVIVWMAEKMNEVAANKLLKTLEEPLGHTLIIMVAESSDTMLQTILSRSQVVKVPEKGFQNTWPEEYHLMFVNWMRMLFKLNMQKLSDQVDEMAQMSRDQQKQFLAYTMETIRRCFLDTVAGVKSDLCSGDEKFDRSFPAMITMKNVEAMTEAINEKIYAIERNAHAKIALMQLSFTLSKLIKNR